MLAVSRKRDERVRILCPDGTEVWIVVGEIRGRKVRLCIDAPANYSIHREELVPGGYRDRRE